MAYQDIALLSATLHVAFKDLVMKLINFLLLSFFVSAPSIADTVSYSACQLPTGTTLCNSTVTWTSSSSGAQVYVIDASTGNTTLWSTAPGSYSWPWTIAWPGQIFQVRVGSTITSEVRVFGQKVLHAGVSGGTNFNWYDVVNQNWIPYVNLAGWSTPTGQSAILSQLQSMFNNGQRSLRFLVWHTSQASIGTGNFYTCGSRPRTDSNGSYNLDRTCQNNLAAIIQAAKNMGFELVVIGAAPQWHNNPWECDAASNWSALAQENINVMKELTSIGAQSGMNYLIDLSNEGIPQTGRPQCHWDFVSTAWSQYSALYGTRHTVGFSVAMDSTWTVNNRLAYITTVYGNNPPDVFDLHIYAGSAPDTEQLILTQAHASIQQMPDKYKNKPLLIGETYYNDAIAAGYFKNAAIATGAKIVSLIQWPASRDNTSPSPPFVAAHYKKTGFVYGNSLQPGNP